MNTCLESLKKTHNKQKNMAYNKSGFTLVELSIVITIISLLVVIALPAYKDYTMRAHIYEGFNLATAAKMAVTDHYVTFSKFPETNLEAGLPPDISSANQDPVSSIDISTNGQILISFGTKFGDGLSDKAILYLTPSDATNGAIVWKCSAISAFPRTWLPSVCRQP